MQLVATRKRIATMAVLAIAALGIVYDAGDACESPWFTSNPVVTIK